jgi:hypothetical protein
VAGWTLDRARCLGYTLFRFLGEDPSMSRCLLVGYVQLSCTNGLLSQLLARTTCISTSRLDVHSPLSFFRVFLFLKIG